jgi:hypothetical protein
LRAAKIATWAMSLSVFALVTIVPFTYYRYCYTYAKRLRPVTEDKVYRSGCLTAAGLEAALQKHRFRTVLNLMEETPDPSLSLGYFDTREVREAEVCERYGARMVSLTVDLIPADQVGRSRPEAIDTFLNLMDDPRNYPVLIHCRAGLHRTGVIVALYRMEYEGWTRHEAMAELKSHGFGDFAATAANDYITQYILTYAPRHAAARPPAPAVPGRLMALPK